MDEANLFPSSVEFLRSDPLKLFQKIRHYRDLIFKHIGKLKLNQQININWIRIEYDILEPSNFFKSPNPGVIAWLQRRHLIDLDNLWLISNSKSNEHSIAKQVGIKFCDADAFFKDSGWSLQSKL